MTAPPPFLLTLPTKTDLWSASTFSLAVLERKQSVGRENLRTSGRTSLRSPFLVTPRKVTQAPAVTLWIVGAIQSVPSIVLICSPR